VKKQTDLKRRLLFGSGDILGGGAFTLLSLLYLNFLVNTQALSPGLAGLLLLIGKLFDAVIDPFLGFLTDRTKSRFGRRRVFFLLGIIPVFVSFILLWYGFGISDQIGKFIYFLLIYCLFCGASSLVMVPYNALFPEIAPEYDQRTAYMGTRMLFSIASSIVAGVLPMLIVNRFPDAKSGYLVMGVIFATLYAIPWLFVFFGTDEQNLQRKYSEQGFLRQYFGVFKNRSFRYYIAVFLTGMAGADLLLALFIYYITSVIEKPGTFPIAIGVTIIAELIGSQIWAQVAKKRNKITPIKIGCFIWVSGMIVCLFITAASPIWLLYVAAILIGIGAISCNQVPWSILPDVVDVGELITGKRQEGVYSGIVTFIRQGANALALGLAGLLLELSGYAEAHADGSAAVQTVETVSAVRLIFVFSPIVFIVIAFILASRYPLTRRRFASVLKARELLQAGRPLEDEALKKDIRIIAGVETEKLWGF